MQNDQFTIGRRRTLRWLLAGSAMGLVPFPVLIKTAAAMGRLGYEPEMKRVRGDVRLNGKPAQVGTPVNYGDIVETGTPAMAVLVLGKSVFLVRDNTRLELPAAPAESLAEKAGQVVNLTRGKVLTVLRQSRARFVTPTAVAGIRGTGLYLEAEQDRTYVCLCYGKASLESTVTGDTLETVKTRHHESPRYIYRQTQADGQLIAKAPVINHTDMELTMLESMVGRRPPFAGDEGHY